MKNLFLSVVLLLTVSFAFATNNVEKDSTETLATISMSELMGDQIIIQSDWVEPTINLNIVWEFPVYWEDDYGSGSFGMSGSGSMSDILDAIYAIFFP